LGRKKYQSIGFQEKSRFLCFEVTEVAILRKDMVGRKWTVDDELELPGANPQAVADGDADRAGNLQLILKSSFPDENFGGKIFILKLWTKTNVNLTIIVINNLQF
jgi:hypothetical protein